MLLPVMVRPPAMLVSPRIKAGPRKREVDVGEAVMKRVYRMPVLGARWALMLDMVMRSP